MKAIIYICVFALNFVAGAEAADYAKVRVKAEDLSLHDGDTVRYTFKSKDGISRDGQPILGSRSLRLVGYDTPELKAPGLGMLFDQPLGEEAGQFAKEFVKRARTIYLHVISEEGDKGRLLAHIEADGKFLGPELVREGLAYETVSSFPIESTFPKAFRTKLFNELAKAWFASPIYEAMAKGKPLPFLNPYVWRKVNVHPGMTYNQSQWDALSSRTKSVILRRACENSENNAAIQLPRHEARISDETSSRNYLTIDGKKRQSRFPADLHLTEYRNPVCK